MAIPVHNPLEGDRPSLTIPLHNGSEEQISIIIIHKDTVDYLNILLQSISVCSENNNYEIIVVDNASTKEDSLEYLEALAKDHTAIKVIRNEENLYWSAAANKGAQAANKNSKYMIFMHSDVVILNPGWLDLLINASETHKSGLIGLEMDQYSIQGSQKMSFIQEWCMLLTRECWEKIGPWAERLPAMGHAFIMTLKAQKYGFKPQALKNRGQNNSSVMLCWHYRKFGININEWEKIVEKAYSEIPRLLREVQAAD